MDSAGDDEQRSDKRYEAYIFIGCEKKPRGIVKREYIIKNNNESETVGNKRIVLFPPNPVDERYDGNGEEQKKERKYEPSIHRHCFDRDEITSEEIIHRHHNNRNNGKFPDGIFNLRSQLFFMLNLR